VATFRRRIGRKSSPYLGARPSFFPAIGHAQERKDHFLIVVWVSDDRLRRDGNLMNYDDFIHNSPIRERVKEKLLSSIRRKIEESRMVLHRSSIWRRLGVSFRRGKTHEEALATPKL